MASMRAWLGEALGEADAVFLGRAYAAVSVDAERTRRRLGVARKPFVDPSATAPYDPAAVDATARWVVEQSRLKVTALGGIAGLGGAASVPPEALASTIASLRLAQRLAVVYGFDPRSDRGEQAVWRALAAGFDVELPPQGPAGLRVSQVPAVIVRGARSRYPAGALATAVLRQTAWSIGKRMTRWLALPVVSAGVSAAGAHRRFTELGEKMREALARLAEAPSLDPERVRDAIEVT